MTSHVTQHTVTSSAASEPGLLTLQGITAGYGAGPALRDVSLTVPKGTLVALLGANGAGKSTLLAVAAGLLRNSSGKVLLNGEDLTRRPAHQRLRHGLCLIPEGRGVFPSLTVRENLELQVPPWNSSGPEAAISTFPVLGKRLGQVAGSLSGGEQQMLAMARAVLAEPQVVLLDEISMGLAPLVVDQLYVALQALADTGMSMLIVEQYVQRALELCTLACILNKGEIVYSGPTSALGKDVILEKYLGSEARGVKPSAAE